MMSCYSAREFVPWFLILPSLQGCDSYCTRPCIRAICGDS